MDPRDEKSAAEEYPELGVRVRHPLWQGGYRSRQQVLRATNAELLALPGIDDVGLREIRAAMPMDPPE